MSQQASDFSQKINQSQHRRRKKSAKTEDRETEMKVSKNNRPLNEPSARPALTLRLMRGFVMLLLALGAGSTANAQLAVTNGNFSNVTGLTYSGGWYGGTSIPIGWTAPYFSGSDDPYMVYNPSGGNYYFNMSTTGNLLAQTVGTVANDTPVVLTFDSSTVFNGGTSLEVFILDSSYNVLASGTILLRAGAAIGGKQRRRWHHSPNLLR